MKPMLALALALLPVVASAAPVHIALHANAVVQPDAADYFTIGSIADLSGGAPALRLRLANIRVGRAPLPGNVRQLNQGDLALKLREAGFQPGRDAVVGGATEADVTLRTNSAPPPAASSTAPAAPAVTSPETRTPPVAPAAQIHPGDPVTIRIDDGDIRISAAGVARSEGTVGQIIRVYRPGSTEDVNAVVIDAQTVELEM